jgi:hypothetical protein
MNNKVTIKIKYGKTAALSLDYLEKQNIDYDYQSNFEIIHSRRIDRSNKKIPQVALIAGLFAFLGTIAFQYWAGTVYYPLNIGNKPFFTILTALPYAFEIAVLFAVTGASITFMLSAVKKDKKHFTIDYDSVIVHIDNTYFNEFKEYCEINKIEYEIIEANN